MSSSSNNDGDGCFLIILLILAGYVVMNTDNPLRDAVHEKAFEMSVEHVKSKLFGK